MNWRLVFLSVLFLATLLVGTSKYFGVYVDFIGLGMAFLPEAVRRPVGLAVLALYPVLHYVLAVLVMRTLGLRWWRIACGVIALVALEVWSIWEGLFIPFAYIIWSTRGFAP